MMSDMSEETENVDVEVEDTEEKAQVEQKDASTEDELQDYSKGVQKRISQLTKKYREEEKRSSELERAAQQLAEENNKLKDRMKQLDTGFLQQMGARLQTQEASLKQAHKDAYDTGDTDRMFEISQQLARIESEKQKYETAKQRAENKVQVQTQEQDAPVAQQQQPVRQQKKLDPKAESWAQKNDWFGEDDIMTASAFAIHHRLVEEAFDPQTDEYYTELDSRIRNAFPHKFQTAKKTGGGKVASASSSASRTTKQGRRSVKLTPSAVDLAKRLGVPLEEYAKFYKE
jgi:DNA repair exonuclease SbcCD ATPase subunit